MPALNFKKRFAPDVAFCRKRQTIRARRKDGRNPHPGQKLYLYTGMRTKSCVFMGWATCKNVEEITIHATGDILIAGKRLNAKEKDKLAVDDGFHDFADFMSFFTKNTICPFGDY